MEPFAILQNLQDRWRPLDGPEDKARAIVLLSDASNMIRERWTDIDARLASGAIRPETLERIVVGMVKRAMLAPDDDGVESRGVTTGPFGDNVKYANPEGNLYFKAADVEVLDGYNRPTARMGWLC